MRKTTKANYQQLLGDLERQRFHAKYTTIIIGALGHYSADQMPILYKSFPKIEMKDWKNILFEAVETLIDGAYIYKLILTKISLFNHATLLPDDDPLVG